MECTKMNCPMQAGTTTNRCGDNCPWRTTAKDGDLISRAAALGAIDNMKPMQGNMEQLAMKALCWTAVKTIQPVDAAPVRYAYWQKISPAGIYECSICGQNVMTRDIWSYHYCLGCGAKMDGDDNG